MKMNENVVKLLKEQIWYIATYSDEPNAVPFKDACKGRGGEDFPVYKKVCVGQGKAGRKTVWKA